MPIGLPGEDGFLRSHDLNGKFHTRSKSRLYYVVPGAFHIFESQRTIRGVFRHNVRLAIGTAINVLLFRHFRTSQIVAHRVCNYIRDRNAADPNWINELIFNEIQGGKYFVVDKSFILRRLRLLFSLPVEKKVRNAPIVLTGVVFDLVLFFVANHLMRRGAGAGYW